MVETYAPAVEWEWSFNSTSWCYDWTDRVYDAITGEWVTRVEAAQLQHARQCRRRDLSALYTAELPKFIPIRKPVVIRFQPCWSSRRWRSVT